MRKKLGKIFKFFLFLAISYIVLLFSLWLIPTAEFEFFHKHSDNEYENDEIID